jgi:hypothetical protein
MLLRGFVIGYHAVSIIGLQAQRRTRLSIAVDSVNTL